MSALKFLGGALIFIPVYLGMVKLVEYVAPRRFLLGWLVYGLGLTVSIGALLLYGRLV